MKKSIFLFSGDTEIFITYISYLGLATYQFMEIHNILSLYYGYPGSQAPFWGEEVTSPAIVGLNTILVRLCHPIEGLGGLLTKFFWHDG